VIGPTLGGLLIDLGGWRSTLSINIPLGVASFIVGALFLPGRSIVDNQAKANRFDWLGIGLFAATLLTLLLFLMDPHVRMLWLLAACLAAGVGFAVWELRRADPFIDVRVFSGNLPLLATYVRTVAAYTVSYAFLYGYTQWLEEGRGLTASMAGLMLLPTFGLGIVVSTLTGRREAVRAKLIVGGIIQVVACALLLVLGGGSAMWLLLAVPALLALPQGLISLANQNALYRQAQPERIGASAGLLRTFMYLGAMTASSATGLFFGQRASTPGLHHLALFALAASALMLGVTLLDRSLSRRAPAPAQ
jgi:predicted MFS family arabinose efflux permease